MTARVVTIVVLLATPGAVLSQLAGADGSAYQSLTVRKPAGLVAKLPADLKSPWVFPTSSVSALAFSPDGRWVATASYARNLAGEERHLVHLWDRRTGVARWEFDGHIRPITRMQFSADSTHLLVSHDLDSFHRYHPADIVVWKVAADGEPRTMLARYYTTTDWSLTGDGTTLVVGRANPDLDNKDDSKRFKGFTFDIVDFPSHKIRRTITHADKIAYSFAVSPDGSMLAAGTEKEILLWDVRTGKPLPGITGLKERVHLVQFSPDGKTLASVSDDHLPAKGDVVDPDFLAMTVKREVELWDVRTRKKTGALQVAARGTFTRLSFIDNNTLLTYVYATMGRSTDVFEFWDLEKRAGLRTVHAGVVAVFDDGRKYAHNRDGQVRYGPTVVVENLR
jgi:WD40 repeat protein